MAHTVALIAHDGKKDAMVDLVKHYRTALGTCHLIATGTTGGRVAQAGDLEVETLLSGPLGGDAQIASRIAQGEVALVIFLVDPLYAHPHEPDIQGLLRVCNVYNVPLATNTSTAEALIRHLLEHR